VAEELTIRIANANPDDPTIPLGQFVTELEAVLEALRKTEGASEGPESEWEIISIKQSSPAEIVLRRRIIGQPATAGPQATRAPVVSRFLSHLQELSRHPEAPRELDRDTLQALGKVAAPGTAERLRVTFANGDGPQEILPAIHTNVTALLAPKTKSVGTVEGSLESVNVHSRRRKVFSIYPVLGPEKITCVFPPRLIEDAGRGLGRNVRVHGLLTYLARDKYPSSVRVSQIDILPPDEELPDLMDLWGAAPDLTGGQSSDDFHREIRRAWE
jgi:hypothetical protein